MIGHMGSHEWRSDSHPADRINELERELAQLKALHANQTQYIKELQEINLKQKHEIIKLDTLLRSK